MSLLVAAPAANAAAATGQATVLLQPSTAKSNLLKKGVKLRGAKNGRRVSLRVSSLQTGRQTVIALQGRVLLGRGNSRVAFRRLQVRVQPKRAIVVGTVAKRRVALFRVAGGAQSTGDSINLRRAALALTAPAARILRAKLGPRSISPGRLGVFVLRATARRAEAPTPTPPSAPDTKPDPCALEKTADGPATVPPAADPPDLEGTAVSSGRLDWGVRKSLRQYVAAGGAVVPVAPTQQLPTGSFRFPVNSGEFVHNESAEPQVVAHGAGSVAFCHAPHSFKIVISQPTVVIDGTDSRLIADVETNMFGLLTPAQRVDLATIDLGESPTISSDEESASWDVLPTTLTPDGVDALCNPAVSSPCSYKAGDELDPVTLGVVANPT